MRKRGSSASGDPDKWEMPDLSGLDATARRSFDKRKIAIDLYLKSDTALADITRRTEMSRSEIWRLGNRACETMEDGRQVGYLACIPGLHRKAYERTDLSDRGVAGKFGAFLKNYPEMHAELDSYGLGKKRINSSKIRGRASKGIWHAFRNACKEHGIDVQEEYPFSNKDGGKEVVRVYVEKLRKAHFIAGARTRFGNASGRLAASAGTTPPSTRASETFSRVQFDGHRLDTRLTVSMIDPAGDEVFVTIARLWLLVIIDERSRAVLGYSLSLAAESYSMDDVLECLGRSLEPWVAKSLPTNAICYLPGAGLPSGVIEQCAWRIFDTIKLDNAWCHHSEWVQDRILQTGVLEIITNVPGSPRQNAIIERFFQTFEEATCHRWPNTTGSGPSDPRRGDPDAAAKTLKMTLEDLEIVADVAIANYNATPHTSLSGRSPLDFIKYRLERRHDIVRYARSRTLAGLGLFERDFKVTIRGSAKSGHRAYVKFLHVRYSSSALATDLRYQGKKATLRVDITDIRTGKLFVEGKFIDEVQAESSWMALKHDAKLRRAIFALIRERKLAIDQSRPVSSYIDYLTRNESATPKQRSRLVKATIDTGGGLPPTETILEPVKRRGIRPGQPGWINLTKSSTR